MCDTCFYTRFQRLFKNIVFRSVRFSQKKVMGYFIFSFYTLRTFYRPVPYPMHKKNYKKSFKLLFIKSKKMSR